MFGSWNYIVYDWFSRIVTTRVLLLDRCTILIVMDLLVFHLVYILMMYLSTYLEIWLGFEIISCMTSCNWSQASMCVKLWCMVIEIPFINDDKWSVGHSLIPIRIRQTVWPWLRWYQALMCVKLWCVTIVDGDIAQLLCNFEYVSQVIVVKVK